MPRKVETRFPKITNDPSVDPNFFIRVGKQDSWETPEPLAKHFAMIVKDRTRVLEFAAGNGNITRFASVPITLNPLRSYHAIEVSKERYQKGQSVAPQATWINRNFITYAKNVKDNVKAPPFDIAIGNPPWSVGMNFIYAAAWIIEESAMVVVLLPSDFFQSNERFIGLLSSGLSIVGEDKIVGRVAYERNGVRFPGKQRYDSFFYIKKNSNSSNPIRFFMS